MNLPHRLERTVVIQAPPETVFRYFEDSDRFARWWGAGSTIDPRPGGRVYIRYPNGVETIGEVVEVAPPERIVFTYGYATGKPIPPGGSLVTINLDSDPAGTRLRLLHEFEEAGVRDQHVQGWRFQLSVFANSVADEFYAQAAGLVDAWFEAWAIADAAARSEALARVAAPGIVFRDRYSMLEGLADLEAHVAAAQRFMPGIRLQRKGDVRHCQGAVLADWTASGADGQERMAGANVFLLGLDSRFTAVTGFAR